MNVPAFTFIAYGPNSGPVVVCLTASQSDQLQWAYGHDHRWENRTATSALIQRVAGGDRNRLIPCVEDCLRLIVAQYEGVHAAEIKGVCAALLLGRPLRNPEAPTQDATAPGGDDKGGNARLVPVRPRKPSPSAAVRAGAQS